MLILTLIFLLLLIIFPFEVSGSISSSLDLCLKSVIPALFPFLCASGIITEIGIPANLFTLFLSEIFKISPVSAPVWILSLLCGYPVGAKMALELFSKGKIGQKEKDRLLVFANNSGPGFITGVVGGAVFNNFRVGIVIYISHILASVIYGFITSFFQPEARCTQYVCTKNMPFLTLLSSAIKDSIGGIINITGVILFFSSVISLLDLVPFISAFPLKGLLFGLLEMTSGIKAIALSSLSVKMKASVAAFLVTFSGFSVFMQIKAFSDKINTASYFSGKMLCGIFAFIITFFLI